MKLLFVLKRSNYVIDIVEAQKETELEDQIKSEVQFILAREKLLKETKYLKLKSIFPF